MTKERMSPETSLEVHKAKMEALSATFVRVFNSPDGEEVLKYLRSVSTDKSELPNSAVDGMALALLTQFRLGENNLMKTIDLMIKRGKNL